MRFLVSVNCGLFGQFSSLVFRHGINFYDDP